MFVKWNCTKIWTMILSVFFRRIYDSLYDFLDGSTIPHAVVILADYFLLKSAFVSDQEINLLACMTELMGQVKFK